MAARYRSKSQEVEAVRWTGGNVDDLINFADEAVRHWAGRLMVRAGKDVQSWVLVPIGHWVVRETGDRSDYWPVDPEHFAEKYERI